jgi:hypothetical protein
MDSNEGQIKRIVLKRMGRCRTCHRVYTHDDVSVVSRKPDMWMMVVECMDCRGKNFVAAVLNEGDPAQAEIALRRMSLGSEDAFVVEEVSAPAARVDPVTPGDVADMHIFLKDFDGDFIKTFRDAARSQGKTNQGKG